MRKITLQQQANLLVMRFPGGDDNNGDMDTGNDGGGQGGNKK